MWAVYLIQSVTESCHACTLLAHTCHTHIYINAVTVQIGENTAPQIGLSDYTLTCSISGIVDRNATYRWIKDSNTQIWNSTGTNSSILSFASPLKLSDAGNYTCEVSIARESPSLASSVMATIEASWAVTIESKLPVMHCILASDSQEITNFLTINLCINAMHKALHHFVNP